MSARPSFIVDLNKCTGCHACAMSCRIANELPAALPWREVHTFNELHVPGVEQLHLSLACNHCAEAPCMEQCPARAYRRDERTGAVLIDADACIGCRYCAWVCPYGAPRFDESRGVMTKCTFCVEKQHEGGTPACVTSCPTGALTWGELTDDERDQAGWAPEVPGFADENIGPAIRIEPVNPARRIPETTHPPAMPPWRRLREKIIPQITLTHEWTLALFTLLVPVLVGIFTGWRLGGAQPDWRIHLGAGVAGLVLSASHLGHAERSWRAALHLDGSWLSREIGLVGGFLGLSCGVLVFPGLSPWLGGLAVVAGFATLAAVDRVYRVASIRGAGPLNSAQVTGTGLLIVAVWNGLTLAAATLVLVKLVLYAARKRDRAGLGLATHPLVLGLRGTASILGVIAMGQDMPWPALILILAGEAIDRGEFYREMEIPTPASLQLDRMESRPEAHAVFGGEKNSTRSSNAGAQGGSR